MLAAVDPALMLVVALIGGGVFGLYKMRVDIPPVNTPKIYAYLDYMWCAPSR